MPKIADNLTQVLHRMEQSALLAGRNANSVQLLAVSKTKPASDIMEAYQVGQRHFGENYLQEAMDKIHALQSNKDIVWHFIGPLQSNKTRLVAEHFHWLHTLDRIKIAARLSEQRPTHLPPLQVCIQVNIDHQESKSGCSPDEAIEFAKQVATLPNLTLRGLMAIPSPTHGAKAFKALSDLKNRISQEAGISLDTLSMGMSSDMDDAIAAGATIIRIGTAIFGERERQD